MPDILVQRDTVDEVLRSGRELVALCKTPDPKIDPGAFMRAYTELSVLLDELEAAADG